MPNLKSVAQVVSEIWKMKYFGGHLGIEDSAPWGPKFANFVFVIQGTSVQSQLGIQLSRLHVPVILNGPVCVPDQ